MSSKIKIAVIGAGLAGSETAWQLAKRGSQVTLFEMRPHKLTPAHKSGTCAELVCSNSFKSLELSNAHGLLKEELKRAGSLIMEAALTCSLPAGNALAVDRELFSTLIQKKLISQPNITLQREEITDPFRLREEYSHVIIASGPLTSAPLAKTIGSKIGGHELYFYDSIAPVIFTESIDFKVAYKASRYNKGTADYLNCPLSEEIYLELVTNLIKADKIPFNSFEQERHFEGCLPIEVLAARGTQTLSFGPMKPVGLPDPRTGRQPFAVLQLRQENTTATLYNLVGCQTRMKWPEQKRVFQKIPALSRCEFARYGSMHRNTYINAPQYLDKNLELKSFPGIYLAGQITGVEGYIESTATGLWIAMAIDHKIRQKKELSYNPLTMLGGLLNYLQNTSPENFQPMNANFGLLPQLEKRGKLKRRERRVLQSQRALMVWESQIEEWNGSCAG